MEKYYILGDTELFSGLELTELKSMLPCLGLRTDHYDIGDEIISTGDIVSEVGFILEGEAEITKTDSAGNITYISKLYQGDMFGEIFVCANVVSSPVTVMAIEPCEIVMFNFNRLISCCSNCCPFHAKVVANLLKMMARKNLQLNDKIEVMSKKTTRNKLATYLLMQMERSEEDVFNVPLNRSELADYLSVDRSAMSRELGRLREEGVLDFSKNQFKIIDVNKLAV